MISQLRHFHRLIKNSLFIFLGTYFFSYHLFAIEWPQEVIVKEGKIIVYQPQPEKLEGNLITGRSAMSIELINNSDPIFGVFWFTARIDTSLSGDVALIREFKVTQVRWPESKDFQEQKFTSIVNNAIPKSGFEISQQRLAASLATAELEFTSLENLNNQPPIILFRDALAVLILFDGKPRFDLIKNSQYQRAINTPYLVIKDGSNEQLYLSNGSQWFSADSLDEHWQKVKQVPQSLVDALPESAQGKTLSATSEVKNAQAPSIVIAIEPTELIVSDGKPNWVALSGGELLYVSNTETPWLRDLSTGNMYLLLSGRWYRAKTIKGTWTFVKADELPKSFQNIPPESAIGGIRTSVAGTIEADDAVLDAKIPQTAAIDRKSATLAVSYDGEPKFIAITGTKVSYANNTASQVLLIEQQYYAVDNGVWFVADSPTGPWQVADNIPREEIATIPANTPVYNTTYVHVYHSTPTVVYVGYTPGYMWSFPYYGAPVYGTGWYYPPYVGPIYYPRPPTWGMHAGYNPWTGWHYGASWGVGFIGAGMVWGGHHHHHGGWYGGHHGNIDIDIDELTINRRNIDRGNINIGNNISAANRSKIEKRLSQNPSFQKRKQERMSIYNKGINSQRLQRQPTGNTRFKSATATANRQNNVYADKQGRVARRTENGWQTRNGGQWKNATKLNNSKTSNTVNKKLNNRKPTSPTINRQLSSRVSNNNSRSQQLNNAYNARQNGAMRDRANSRMSSGGATKRFRR